MELLWRKCALIFFMLISFSLIEGGLMADYADARSRSGGRSFSSSPGRSSQNYSQPASPASPGRTSGGFGRSLMGGLLGGAIGGILFGSLFGAGGTGMGILPLLVLGGIGYFLYKKVAKARQSAGFGTSGPSARQEVSPLSIFGDGVDSGQPPSQTICPDPAAAGISLIRQTDRNFDPAHFTEVASDMFFQVQAGWMRRDLDSYRHLLGEQLASQYAEDFAEMRSKGHINKLESIAVRGAEIVQAGSDGREDFVTVLFTANLLDYTVDDKSGDLVSGSMSTPVKFREEWTWARPTGTHDWKLEGIKQS